MTLGKIIVLLECVECVERVLNTHKTPAKQGTKIDIQRQRQTHKQRQRQRQRHANNKKFQKV